MFDGGGFGVAVTVAQLAAPSWPVEQLPNGVVSRPTRLGEVVPVRARSDAELAAELQRVERGESALAAYKLELVAALASRRPAERDLPQGAAGAASPDWAPGPGNAPAEGVSEFFADELALVLNCSRSSATRLADASAVLVHELPTTWAALADGQLDWPRARALAAELSEPAREVEPAVLAAVEAAVLPRASGLSIPGVRALARKELIQRDAAAAERRRRQAEKAADVTVRPMRDGMAEFRAFLPQPMAAALRETIDGYARLAESAGEPGTIGQLRTGVLADLVLRPWDSSRPPVTAHLQVIAPLGTVRGRCCGDGEPAEVNGEPITTAQLRDLLEQLDALCPGGLQAPVGGTLHLALVDPRTGALRATVSRAELERLVRRGCPDHPDGDCACPVLARPGPVDRYRPGAAQRRFLEVRDRTCRHPGCRNRAGWADLDHVVPHAEGGETACENLCCLCRRHHRLKTFAPGWIFAMDDDGVLTVTTPSGVTRVTRPPGMRAPGTGDDDPPPF